LSDVDAKPKPHPGWSLVIDYGPLLVFFLAFRIGGIFAATGSFMVAIVVAIIVSRWRLNRVSPMLWLSAVLVLGFGGLTLWLHDPVMIRYKATFCRACSSSASPAANRSSNMSLRLAMTV
jgi:intracellular septation protein